MFVVMVVKEVSVVTFMDFQDLNSSSMFSFNFIYNCEFVFVFMSVLGQDMSLINPFMIFDMMINPKLGNMCFFKFTMNFVFVLNVWQSLVEMFLGCCVLFDFNDYDHFTYLIITK